MTTQTTKPERVAVGQRWTNGCGDYATVVKTNALSTILRWDDGEETDPATANVLAHLAYLGPTEPRGGDAAPPAPAVGQRWRDAVDGTVYTLTERRYGSPAGWYIAENRGHFRDPEFTNGRMTFVNHGTTAPPKTAPSVPPKLSPRAGAEPGIPDATNVVVSGVPVVGRTGGSIPPTGALQPLATFFIPGDVVEQPIAYATRTRTRAR